MADGISIGSAYVQIIPSMKDVTTNIAKVMEGGEVERIGRNSGQKMSAGMRTALVAGTVAGIAVIGKKISNAAGEWINAYNVQNEAETKLTEVMKTRMGATEDQIQGIKDYASELQNLGVVGDEVSLSGGQQLATFLKTDSALKTLMPAMQNLAVQQNGVNVTSENMVSIGNLMGKAMQGQVSALKRVGISFTDAQAEVLKFGTEQEKAAMLAQVITDNVGNMNATIAQTDSGKIQQYKNSLGDIQEVLGQKVQPIQVKYYETLNKLGTFMVDTVIPFVEKYSSQLKTLAVFIGSLVAVMTVYNAVMAIKTAVDAAGAVSLGAYAIAQAAALAPILAVAAALTAAIVVGYKIIKNWDKIKVKAVEVAGIIRDRFVALKDKLLYPFKFAYDKIKWFLDKIKGFFPIRIGNILSNLKLPHFSVNPDGWKLSDLLKGELPRIGVEWYAKGGVFNGPSVIGVGEAGPEAVVPLDKFWDKLDKSRSTIINFNGNYSFMSRKEIDYFMKQAERLTEREVALV